MELPTLLAITVLLIFNDGPLSNAQVTQFFCNTQGLMTQFLVEAQECTEDFRAWWQRYLPGQGSPGGPPFPWRPTAAPSTLGWPNPDFLQSINMWPLFCSKWKFAADCLRKDVKGCFTEQQVMDAMRGFIGSNMGKIFPDNSQTSAQSSLLNFYDRACYYGQVKQDVIRHMAGFQPSCIDSQLRQKLSGCYKSLEEEKPTLVPAAPPIPGMTPGMPGIDPSLGAGGPGTPVYQEPKYEGPVGIDGNRIDLGTQNGYLSKLAEDGMKCIRTNLLTSNCNPDTQKMFMEIGRLSVPSTVPGFNGTLSNNPYYLFRDINRKTCGAYGDPHVKLCKGKWQTCNFKGFQTLLSNQFLSIEGVGVQVGAGTTGATALNQVLVTFRSQAGTTVLGTFTADGADMPPTFDASGTTIGLGGDEVTMEHNGPNSRIMIHHSSGSVVIVTRAWEYFSVTYRAAASVTDNSYGLLISGCPPKLIQPMGMGMGGGGMGGRGGRPMFKRSIRSDPHPLNVQKRNAGGAGDCKAACNNAQMKTPYLKTACLFDCQTCRDVGAAQMAIAGDIDIQTAESRDDMIIRGVAYGGATSFTKPGSLMLCILLLIVTRLL